MQENIAKLDRAIGLFEDIISISSLVVISLLVITQVFFRYVLNEGILWVDEVVTILMVAMVLLGAPAVTRRGLHTELLVFVDLMPKPVKRATKVLTSFIGLAFLAIFLFASTKYAMDAHGMVTTVLRIPMQYVYCILPIGALLANYEYIKKMFADFRGSKSVQ